MSIQQIEVVRVDKSHVSINMTTTEAITFFRDLAESQAPKPRYAHMRNGLYDALTDPRYTTPARMRGVHRPS